MEIKEQEAIKKHCAGEVIKAVECLFNNQDLIIIAPDIVSACCALGRDEGYEDDTKVNILLSCMTLMSDLIALSESYNNYRDYQTQLCDK